MVAEYALRAQTGETCHYRVMSAGIEAKPQFVHPVVRARLVLKGADPGTHVQQRLTSTLMEQASLIIAMGTDHQAHIEQAFRRRVPLFNHVAMRMETSILDLHEALPDWELDLERARAYVEEVVDHIWGATPALIARLPQFL
jgi:protein-tyrosine phosphatase